jgi:hypothetical protein
MRISKMVRSFIISGVLLLSAFIPFVNAGHAGAEGASWTVCKTFWTYKSGVPYYKVTGIVKNYYTTNRYLGFKINGEYKISLVAPGKSDYFFYYSVWSGSRVYYYSNGTLTTGYLVRDYRTC